MAEEVVLESYIDQILEKLPVGSIQRALANNLYGINFRQTGDVIPRSKDIYGFTFFTRPQLNMTTANLSQARIMYSLLTDNELSYQRYVRMLLDPRLGEEIPEEGAPQPLKCPFLDNKNPFIATLTNNIISISGWPDLTVPTRTSEQGLYFQEHSIVDGPLNHFEAFDVDATFRNARGNPIIYLFYVWLRYMSFVFEGVLTPYADFILENEIDYNTRIYRIVLDNTKRYVRYIAATGASFPLNVPTGNIFDFNKESPINNRNNEINIRFRCLGFTAFDEILKLEFNKTLAIFNPDMRKLLYFDMEDESEREHYREDPTEIYEVGSLVKIPYLLTAAYDMNILTSNIFKLNYRCYPYINIYTNELEWWTYKNIFYNSDFDEEAFSESISILRSGTQ